MKFRDTGVRRGCCEGVFTTHGEDWTFVPETFGLRW